MPAPWWTSSSRPASATGASPARPEIAARRLISFISQSPLILEGADHAFYQRFLRIIGQHVRDLERHVRAGALPLPAAHGGDRALLCGPVLRGPRRHACAARRACSPASSIGRSSPMAGMPAATRASLVDLLFDLLPLRQMFASREVDTPEALLHAIDRMLPMVRLFRHGDGTLSHFNGMGVTAADHLATLLTYDDMRSQPIQHAPHSGYERLEAGRTLLVADVGAPPPTPPVAECRRRLPVLRVLQRRAAHRGQLRNAAASPTMRSSRPRVDGGPFDRLHRRRVVVPVRRPKGGWLHRSARALASAPGRPRRRSAGPSGWRRSAASASTSRSSTPAMTATSSASASPTSGAGSSRPRAIALEGEDNFLGEGGRTGAAQAIIRFHLAPGIKASRAQGGRVVMLVLPNREAWQFTRSPGRGLRRGQHFSRHRRRHAADGADRADVRPDETPVGALALRASGAQLRSERSLRIWGRSCSDDRSRVPTRPRSSVPARNPALAR